MRLFNNKRGDVSHHVVLIIGELLLAAMMFLGLMSFTISIAEKTYFDQLFLARDTAFIMNVLNFIPGELSYTYKNDAFGINRFTFSFAGGIATVESNPENDASTKVLYPYGASPLDEEIESVDKHDAIYFYKDNKAIKASPEKQELKLLLGCPDAETLTIKNIAVDFESPSYAAMLNEFVVDSLSQYSMQEKIRHIAVNRDKIGLFIGIYPGDTDKVARAYIYYDSNKKKQSIKLACNVLNKLRQSLNSNELLAVSIVMADFSAADKDDPVNLLRNRDFPAFILKLGDAAAGANNNLLNEKAYQIISDAIMESVT